MIPQVHRRSSSELNDASNRENASKITKRLLDALFDLVSLTICVADIVTDVLVTIGYYENDRSK